MWIWISGMNNPQPQLVVSGGAMAGFWYLAPQYFGAVWSALLPFVMDSYLGWSIFYAFQLCVMVCSVTVIGPCTTISLFWCCNIHLAT